MAAGCQGSWGPVTSTPAAAAAAATRTAAPMLNGLRGFSSSANGALDAAAARALGHTIGRRAMAMMPVSGGTGDRQRKSSGATCVSRAASWGRMSGASSAANRRAASMSGVTISRVSAPKRSPCFTGCRPSITARDESRRAWRKRWIITLSVMGLIRRVGFLEAWV